jgi:hypothetical protein
MNANSSHPSRWAALALCAGAVPALLVGGADPASAAALAVCPSGCPYTELATALAASADGDTITLAAGTYTGGVTIGHSVSLVGAGAASTVIRGGGPVLTIGTYGTKKEPTVSVSGVTVTGGVTRSSAMSVDFTGQDGAFATGGGIDIPPNADLSGGATVTISDSIITGNRVAPSATVPSGLAGCPEGSCPYAHAAGGGISSWGRLTLTGTTVSNNLVGAASGLSDLASDAEGGGIRNWRDDLTIIDSSITGNHTSATAPNGRFADSGAIYASNGAVTVRRSSITGNSAVLEAALPDSVSLLAVGGGVHLGSGASGTFRHSTITDNDVRMTNTAGSALAFSGAIHSDRQEDGTLNRFVLDDVVVADNTVEASALGSDGDAAGDSGAGEMGGSVTGSRLTGNSVTVTAASGDATALGGAMIFRGAITDSVVSSNTVRASSPHGSVYVIGGGFVVDDHDVTLRGTTVSSNAALATGRSGSAQGGGVFDAPMPDGPPGGPLVLIDAAVTDNVVSGTSGLNLQGGGIYLGNTLTSRHSTLAGNTPDQCVGC